MNRILCRKILGFKEDWYGNGLQGDMLKMAASLLDQSPAWRVDELLVSSGVHTAM
jgi:hypothetical protein